MSFEDIKQRIETGFILPLRDFRTRTAPLNTIHNESLNKLSNAISPLVHGPNAFQGSAANALTELVNNFISRERQLSGGDSDPQGWDLTGRLGDASDKNQKYAAFFETVLDTLQNAQPTSTKGIDELSAGGLSIAGGLDAGAGAQFGLDIPWDILAAAASGIALGLAASDALVHIINNPDQQRASAATAVLEQTIPQIEQDYQIIESSDPLPPRMDPPQGPTGDYKSFLLLLGLAIGAGGTVVYLDSNTPVNLTPAQKRLLQDVKSRLGNTPYNEGEIEALIAAGYLDPDAIAAMIKGGTYLVFDYPGIAKKLNTLTGAQQLAIIDMITKNKYGEDLAGSGNDPKRLLVGKYVQIYEDLSAGKITQRQFNTKMQQVNGIVASIFAKPEYISSMLAHNITLANLYATIEDSNVDFRFTPNNAITSLIGPVGTASVEAAGPSGTYGDVKFYGSNGNLIFTRENKSLTSTSRSGFNGAIKAAMEQIPEGHPGEIFLQMQPGTNTSDIESLIKRYMGPRIQAGQAAKYKIIFLKVVDPSGHIIYSDKVMP